MKSIRKLMPALAAVALSLTQANAGERKSNPVTISQYGTWIEATGSLGSARNSADGYQYIGCAILSQPVNGAPWVNCAARDAANRYVSCWSPEQALVNTARAISSTSFVDFNFDSTTGLCITLRVSNDSTVEPPR